MSPLIQHVQISPGVHSLFSLALTIGAYVFGLSLQSRLGSPLANPVLIAILVIGCTLRLLHISYDVYFSGAQLIHFCSAPRPWRSPSLWYVPWSTFGVAYPLW